MQQLVGRVAVVTGAASGIGRALADRFTAEGMRVMLADVEAGPLAAAAEELRGDGHEVLDVVTDVSDWEAVERLADATYDAYGGAHVVCNNAGVGTGGPLWEVSVEDWRWVLGVNLFGVVHGIRAFVPRMVAAGEEGHVVNTASMAGLFSGPGMGAYNASKHAVVAISETLAADLDAVAAPIGVSVLCPGFVNTRIYESDRNRPAGRVERPDGDRFAAFRRMLEGGMSPAAVAERVVEAVRAGRLYVLTHPDLVGVAEQRFRTIVEAGRAVPPGVAG